MYLLVSAVILILLDILYLWVRRNAYSQQIRDVQTEPLRLYAGSVIARYVLLILGLNYFIIFQERSLWDAFFLGCLLYGFMETTNYSIFNKWQFDTVVIDTLWGGVLCLSTTFLTYYLVD
jgi:uncharacterized membrane protein